MSKPQSIDLYDAGVTEDCERVLVTMFSGLGPWAESVYLIGGLTPHYLIKRRPPEVRAHAGTGDLDLLIDLEVLADTEAYETLEANLERMKFQRVRKGGQDSKWQWETWTEEGRRVLVEFLSNDPALQGGEMRVLPTEGKLSAINLPYGRIVRDLHDKIEVTACRLTDGALVTEVIPHANTVSFTCLKAFALQRSEPKDAHDLVYCLENYEGAEPIEAAFQAALKGPHAETIDRAMRLLVKSFTTSDPDDGYKRDGPVMTARFEYPVTAGEDQEMKNLRIQRQREAHGVVAKLLRTLGYVS